MIQRLGKIFCPRRWRGWPGILFGIIFGAVLCAGSAVAADEIKWKELKGARFIVYFSGEESFARDVLNSAERYYTRIAGELGYARYQDFWTWEKRCKIYVHPDHPSFLKASGGQEWSHGLAEYNTKTIVSYAWHEGFLDSLLPHEIAHLIFRDFIGFKGEVPLWLDEGVAQWEEEAKRPQMKAMVKELYEGEGFLLINDMMKLDIRRLKGKEGVHVRAALTKDGSEVTSTTSWLMMPLFLPYLLVQMLVTKPDSIFTLILSLFPATSPAAMLIRLLTGNVQPWEHLVAVTLLLLAIALSLRSVARLFKAQIMLAGQPFNVVGYVKALLRS